MVGAFPKPHISKTIMRSKIWIYSSLGEKQDVKKTF